MDVLLLIIGLVVFCIGTYIGIVKDTNPFPTFMCLLGFGICLLAAHLNTPTALDVYRGNTTLEITYKDSIPVDSVVVFKNK